MQIAQVAPLYESVPPSHYGGTERVVSHLTEALVRKGHDVTLFASGDSTTAAELVSGCPRSLRLNEQSVDHLAPHVVLLEEVYRRADDFDVIHFHVDYLHYPISRRQHHPHITTLHGRLDIPELQPLYREYGDEPVVSISDAQRRPVPDANWKGTVYHGLPQELYHYSEDMGDYFAFLGRISPEKRVDRAIDIARKTEIPLKIAAKVDAVDEQYFHSEIEPLLDEPGIEFIGEIEEAQKGDFLGGAYALLFPIDWPEPFGLVMIEALACGTPVIANRRGSVPEVIEHGKTGFVTTTIEEAIDAARRIPEISRSQCRQTFEHRFTARRMAADYLDVYEQLLTHPDSPTRRQAHGKRSR